MDIELLNADGQPIHGSRQVQTPSVCYDDGELEPGMLIWCLGITARVGLVLLTTENGGNEFRRVGAYEMYFDKRCWEINSDWIMTFSRKTITVV
jgi:hypothetical protein